MGAVRRIAQVTAVSILALGLLCAYGRAVIAEDPRQMAGPIALLAGRYRQYRESPPAGPVIDITVERWTGWAASPP